LYLIVACILYLDVIHSALFLDSSADETGAISPEGSVDSAEEDEHIAARLKGNYSLTSTCYTFS